MSLAYLRRLEAFLVDRLQPIYAGKVDHRRVHRSPGTDA